MGAGTHPARRNVERLIAMSVSYLRIGGPRKDPHEITRIEFHVNFDGTQSYLELHTERSDKTVRVCFNQALTQEFLDTVVQAAARIETRKEEEGNAEAPA
jgi:hypothetical protein